MARSRSKIEPQFWENKALSALSPNEWEAVCDRCGLCCLEKLEDPEKGEIYITSITCHFFELSKCHCLIYDHRYDLHPDCIELTPDNIGQLNWLPETCAYRLLAQGKRLPAWHYLICGDPQAVHEAGISVRDKAVCGRYADPSDRKTAIIGPPIIKFRKSPE